MAFTIFSSNTRAKASEVNENFDYLLRINGYYELLNEKGSVLVTVSSTETDILSDFSYRFLKAGGSWSIEGSGYSTISETSNSHFHTFDNLEWHGTTASYNYSSSTPPNSYLPEYLALGIKYLAVLGKTTGDFSIPKGGILFSSTSTNYGFTPLSGYYMGLGYGSDGGSSSHTHTINGTTQTSDLGGTYNKGTTVTNPTASNVSNEIDNRIDCYAFYNNGTYDSSKDLIPIGGEILQLISESVPSNYSTVSLSGNTGLVRFTNNSTELLNNGGTTTHTHATTPTRTDGSYDTGTFMYTYTISENNHMPPYKAVRLIRRDS